MNNQKMQLARLLKQANQIQINPIENALVVRQGNLNFHFCLYNLHPPYSGGLYHGLLQLHQNYPFHPPKLFFFTPSGRFQINVPICTSFTQYHKQNWTAAWNVRTLIVAVISFMYSEQPSYGCVQMNEYERKRLARLSKQYNLKNEKFVKLFGQKLQNIRQQLIELKDMDNNSDEIMKMNQILQNNQDLIRQNNINNINPQLNDRGKKIRKILFIIIILMIVYMII